MKRTPPSEMPARLDHARRLLLDGCSYRDAAETVGVSRSTLTAHFPGMGWTYRQAGEMTAYVRRLAREGATR